MQRCRCRGGAEQVESICKGAEVQEELRFRRSDFLQILRCTGAGSKVVQRLWCGGAEV